MSLAAAFRPAIPRVFGRILVSLLLFGAALLAAAPAGAAEDAGAFFRGRTVTLVVGYGAGGGYDTYARLVAPHLAKRLGADVIVENRPGGGGKIALNQVFRAAPDGLTLMLINGSAAVLSQLTEAAGARYDLMKMSWLGRVTKEDHMLMVGAGGPFRSLADLKAAGRPIRWAAGGKADGISDLEAVTCHALHLACKIIIGYKGSKEAALAVIRGEADAITITSSSARAYAKHGAMIALAGLDRGRARYFPDTPTVFEQADLAAGEAWWFDFDEAIRAVGRSLVAPPGMAAARLAFLRGAVAGVLADPGLAAEAKARQHDLDPLPAERLRAFVTDSLGSLDAGRLAEVRRVLLEAYF